MIETGGRWDRDAHPRYFIAGNINTLKDASPFNKDQLIAVNELTGAAQEAIVEGLIEAGGSVFIDSGVFNLANSHAVAHDISMDEALTMAPEKIDGFGALFERYVEIGQRWKDKAWGFVEVDQGGRENKIKTRARLEKLGLRPIPVFHPFNDGWDYFDYLAQRYDRICFGNVVQAAPPVRKRLVATAWERRRRYPHLWIHLLGLTPYSYLLGFPANSCDSSTWLWPARWGKMPVWAATQPLWFSGKGFVYDKDADQWGEKGNHRCYALCGYDAAMVGRTMRRFADDQRTELGCDPGGSTIEGLADAQPAKGA